MAFQTYSKSPEESKRISWLSIFSSLLQSRGGITTIDDAVNKATEINKRLFETYPTIDTPFPSAGDGASLGICKECGAPMVKNPKTGKIFCSAKCWLKK